MSEPVPLIFPKVVITKIPDRFSAYARYFERAKPRRIELDPDVANLHEREQLLIIIHELGHWFRFEHILTTEVHQFQDKIDQEEHFAHAFARYFLSPASLKRSQPGDYDLIHRKVGDHHDAIISFARKCVSELERKTP